MSYIRSTLNDSVPSSRTYRRLRVTRQKESDTEPIKEEISYSRRREFVSTQSKPDTKTSSKSSLVQSMTANFERSYANSSDSPTKGRRKLITNYNSVATSISEKPASATSSFASSTNGAFDGSEAVLDVKENKEVSSRSENSKKASASRRARLQREKRMLRQKRRSTGVVSLKDLENEDGSEDDDTKEDENLKNETQLNTIQNEFTSNDSGAISNLRVNKLSIDEDKKIDQPIKDYQLTSSPKKLDKNNETELKEKLFLSEAKIKRLTESITNMEKELNKFSDENQNLKRKNKLLEDENKTMLRLIKARGFE